MDRRLDRVDQDIRGMRGELGSMHRLLVRLGVVMLASSATTTVAILGLIATRA